MNQIKMLLFDMDGVITDGKKYIDGGVTELKSVALKDLDAFPLIKDSGCMLGCVTGEDTAFSRQFAEMQVLDYVRTGCKQKVEALQEIQEKYGIVPSEICYVGDGKYDVPAMEKAGLAICPSDAIEEVKKISDVVLKRKGGEGCMAEIYTLLFHTHRREKTNDMDKAHAASVFLKRVDEHREVVNRVLENAAYCNSAEKAASIIIESYQNAGKLFLCGNGGSAADAQHLAAELVGRFYMERKALNAEALTVNTSILTALTNDYSYDMIFARQLEAKAAEGDVLIGITTSGTSENVLQAFRKAKGMRMKTILMTGEVSEFAPILKDTDCLLAVPSHDTPRIQEIHILTGHIICEMVERELTKR